MKRKSWSLRVFGVSLPRWRLEVMITQEIPEETFAEELLFAPKPTAETPKTDPEVLLGTVDAIPLGESLNTHAF